MIGVAEGFGMTGVLTWVLFPMYLADADVVMKFGVLVPFLAMSLRSAKEVMDTIAPLVVI